MLFKTAMLLFLVSLAIFKLAKVSTGSLSTAPSFAKTLLESFTSEDIEETNVTAAEEMVRGLIFDKYNEEILTQEHKKIKLTDFPDFVSRIATRHQILAEIQEEILDGLYMEVNILWIREVKIQKRQTGSFLYSRTATVKRENSTIDFAFVLFHLEIKLSSRRIEERRRKGVLGITYGSHLRFEERYLSEKEKEYFIFKTPVSFILYIC